MNSAASGRSQVSAVQTVQLDDVCRRFREAWTPFDRPKIEDYLRPLAPEIRGVAFRELLAVEIELRHAANEKPSRDEYATWTHEHGGAIEEAFSLLDSYSTRNVDNAEQTDVALSVGRIGDYDLLEGIGRGGMGVVYRARDRRFDRDVAIKLMAENLSGRDSAAARFVAEAKITGQLQHPGIPAVHDLGVTSEGRPFLAMKLVKGRTLHQMLAGRSQIHQDRGRYLAIFEQICHAVGYAHANSIIHRDLKPQNVMVGDFGEVQVMDWGLAKVLSRRENQSGADESSERPSGSVNTPAANDDVTRTGSVVGTPQYMPPEQATGAVHELDARSDVFGLGAILCEVLTGAPPYEASNLKDALSKAMRGDLQPALERIDASGAEPALVKLTKECLSFKQAERLANGQAAADEVARIRTESEARAREAERDRGEALVREAEGRKRRSQFVIAASAIGIVLLLGVAGSTYGLIEARQAKNRAEQREQEAIHAMKRFGDAVANNSELKNSDKLESLRRELLKEPLVFFTSLRERLQSETSTRPESLQRLAFAVSELGQLTDEIGDKDDALRALQQAKAIHERLAREHPTVDEYQRSLANSHNDIGVLLYKTGKPVEASAEFEAAKAIQERLARENTADATIQSELAASHNNLGNMLLVSGKTGPALAAHEAARAIRARLSKDYPADTTFQGSLAESHTNLGRLFQVTGRPDKALAEYKEANAIFQRLARDNPAVLEFQSNLAANHHNLSILFQESGNAAEALESCKAA